MIVVIIHISFLHLHLLLHLELLLILIEWNLVLYFNHWLLHLIHIIILLLLRHTHHLLIELLIIHIFNTLLFLLLQVVLYFKFESEEDSFDYFWNHFNEFFDFTWAQLILHLLEHLGIKSVPIVCFLLLGMSSWIIVKLNNIGDEVFHDFSDQDYNMQLISKPLFNLYLPQSEKSLEMFFLGLLSGISSTQLYTSYISSSLIRPTVLRSDINLSFLNFNVYSEFELN